MALFKIRRAMEVLLTPSKPAQEAPQWIEAEDLKVRIAGHDVHIRSTKEGLEIVYTAPKNKKPGAVAAEASLQGARLRISP